MSHYSTILASFLGTGYSRIAPGTVGAFLAVVIIYLLSLFVDYMHWIIPVSAILTYIIGIWSIKNLPGHWDHDDNKIVIDEAHGIFVSLMFLPITIKSLAAAFILFRFFDILKPLGIKAFDNLKSDHGVMLDDTLAGLYSNIIIQIGVGCGVVLH